MSEWQPIGSAPRDGTRVMTALFRDGDYVHIGVAAWEFIETSDWDGMKVYDWAEYAGTVEEPTHWLPYLEPPK
jgi:hypothetical protein